MRKKAALLLILCLLLTGCSAEELVQKGTQFLNDLFVNEDRPYVQIIPDTAGSGNAETSPPVEAEEPSIPDTREPSPEPAGDTQQGENSGNSADITPSHTDVTLFQPGEGFRYQPKGVSGVYACTYSSDNPEIAAIDDSTGQVTAVSPGTTVVRMHVESNGQYDFSCTVRCSWKADGDDGPVLPPAAPSGTDTAAVTASHTDATFFNPGESFRFLPVGAGDGYTCTYSSSDSSVAEVDKTTGRVTAVGPGRATITMQVDCGGTEYSFQCVVRCSWDAEDGEPDGPALPSGTGTAAVGASHTDVTFFNPNESFRFLPTGVDGDAVCSYSSGDSTVAKVDGTTGTVTAVGPGKTTVSMSVDWGGNEYEFTCIVRCSW